MNPFYRNVIQSRGLASMLAAFLVVTSLSSSALGWQGASAASAAPARTAAATLTTAERKAAARVKLETIRNVTTRLSAPDLEGRGTGQPGADRAAQYLADTFAKLGLKPAGENGTYLQQIKFRSAQVMSTTSVKVGDDTFKHGTDYVILPPYTFEEADAGGNVVFAGFGVVSPELNRDDFAGIDLKDKVVIILGGQPDGVDPAAWKRATSPQVRAMNVFGKGAKAMIVANAGTTAQPFSTIANYLSRRRVGLASQPQSPFKIPPVVLVSDAAMEKIFAGSGTTYAQTLRRRKPASWFRAISASRRLWPCASIVRRLPAAT